MSVSGEIDPKVLQHVLDALELVEEAQHALERAAQKLSPIIGLAPQCSAIMKERERIRKAWYALDAAKDRPATRRAELDNVHATSSRHCSSCAIGANFKTAAADAARRGLR